MSEMIERCADALERKFKSIISVHAGKSFEETKVSLPNKDVWRAYAKSVIEELREPTEEMLLAGTDQPNHYRGWLL